ncbi:MAG: hypothetical protein RLZZ528_1735 [Pseudomonadota bacterium]
MLNLKPLLTILKVTTTAAALTWGYTTYVSAQSAEPAVAIAPADAQTTLIVNAADAFLASLSAEQREAVLFDWTDQTQRQNWSNFPQGGAGVVRAGLSWGDMTQDQRSATVALLRAVLSEDGVLNVLKQMAADQVVAEAEAAGGADDSGRPPVSFGDAYYFISFVGTPAPDQPWMLQFGGHHLAINATVVGANVTLSPSLTGGEPLRITYEGSETRIAENEVTAGDDLLKSLDAGQLSKAVISDTPANLVLGPGEDGSTVEAEGIAGADLNAGQKELLLAVIRSRLGILNADDLAATMAPIEATLDQTTFGWWGPTEPLGAAYFRVTGPHVVIEFSPQANDGDATNHAHNIYRDPTNDYGAAWANLD